MYEQQWKMSVASDIASIKTNIENIKTSISEIPKCRYYEVKSYAKINRKLIIMTLSMWIPLLIVLAVKMTQ